MMELNRRALIAGAALAGASVAMPAYARIKQRRAVINALGGIWNPNAIDGDGEAASPRLDPRAVNDALAARLIAVNQTIGHVFGEGDPFVLTVEEIGWWQAALRERPEALIHVLSAADIGRADKEKKCGVIFGFQNSEMFAGDPARASVFRDLGVRIVQLTYNIRNAAGDGALVAENRGLTDFGRKLVAALNEKKLLVDLSHAGEKTTMEAIAASSAPIAITHTGCAAIAAHPRSRGDAELRALSEKGGVAGIYFMPFLTPGRQQMAADVVAHIEHAVNVMGEDHVGIGTDGSVSPIDDMEAYMTAHRADIAERRKQGISAPNESEDVITLVPDLMGPAMFERLASLLAARGYKEGRIEKILSGNFLRLFGEVWGG